MNKKQSRLRRARRGRAKIKQLAVPRLCVNKTPNHVYVQLIAPCGSKVLAAASSVEKEIKSSVKYTGNKTTAEAVGALMAKRAVDAGVKKVAFDRSGFKYHGRIKALAEAIRAGGVEF